MVSIGSCFAKDFFLLVGRVGTIANEPHPCQSKIGMHVTHDSSTDRNPVWGSLLSMCQREKPYPLNLPSIQTRTMHLDPGNLL